VKKYSAETRQVLSAKCRRDVWRSICPRRLRHWE